MDISSIHDIYQLRTAQSVNRAARKAEEPSAERQNQGGDSIDLSPAAALSAKLSARRAQAFAPADAGRLEVLRRKYLGESCPVSGTDVARAMLGRAAQEDSGT